MSRFFSLPGIGLLLVILAVIASFLHPYFAQKAEVHLSTFNPNGGYIAETIDMTDEETALWVDGVHAAGFNVDVQVNTHAWARHGEDATNAIRCLTNNGTASVLSEKSSRNLHLICVDPNTGEAWVVIIERIRKYANTLQNASSKLITAFKLENVTVEQYITWETQFKSIAVRLVFKAGELFFKP